MKRNKADANFSNVNPIGKTFEDAPSFNRVWLKTSVPLNGIQRIGFSLLSIVILLGSVMFFKDGLQLVKDGFFSGIFTIAFSVLILFLASWGIWRVIMSFFIIKGNSREDIARYDRK